MSFKVVFLLAVLSTVCAREFAPPPCACGKIYIPVCGSNYITYNNMCEFNCGSKLHKEKFGHAPPLTVLFQGRCDGKN